MGDGSGGVIPVVRGDYCGAWIVGAVVNPDAEALGVCETAESVGGEGHCHSVPVKLRKRFGGPEAEPEVLARGHTAPDL